MDSATKASLNIRDVDALKKDLMDIRNLFNKKVEKMEM